jgi:hypothetical protein
LPDGADSFLGPGVGLLLVAGGVRAGLGGGPLLALTFSCVGFIESIRQRLLRFLTLCGSAALT